MFPRESTFLLQTAILRNCRAGKANMCKEVVMRDFNPTKGFISWFHWLERRKEEKLIIEVSWSQWKAARSRQSSVALDHVSLFMSVKHVLNMSYMFFSRRPTYCKYCIVRAVGTVEHNNMCLKAETSYGGSCVQGVLSNCVTQRSHKHMTTAKGCGITRLREPNR